MIAKKRHPSLLLTGVGCSLGEITRNGCEPDGKTEFLEFSLDFPGTPAGIDRVSAKDLRHLFIRESGVGSFEGPALLEELLHLRVGNLKGIFTRVR